MYDIEKWPGIPIKIEHEKPYEKENLTPAVIAYDIINSQVLEVNLFGGLSGMADLGVSIKDISDQSNGKLSLLTAEKIYLSGHSKLESGYTPDKALKFYLDTPIFLLYSYFEDIRAKRRGEPVDIFAQNTTEESVQKRAADKGLTHQLEVLKQLDAEFGNKLAWGKMRDKLSPEAQQFIVPTYSATAENFNICADSSPIQKVVAKPIDGAHGNGVFFPDDFVQVRTEEYLTGNKYILQPAVGIQRVNHNGVDYATTTRYVVVANIDSHGQIIGPIVHFGGYLRALPNNTQPQVINLTHRDQKATPIPITGELLSQSINIAEQVTPEILAIAGNINTNKWLKIASRVINRIRRP